MTQDTAAQNVQATRIRVYPPIAPSWPHWPHKKIKRKKRVPRPPIPLTLRPIIIYPPIDHLIFKAFKRKVDDVRATNPIPRGHLLFRAFCRTVEAKRGLSGKATQTPAATPSTQTNL